MFRKLIGKIKALRWYQKNEWLLKIIYQAILIVLYINFFFILKRRWIDLQVFLVDPEGVSFLIKLGGAVVLSGLGVGFFMIRQVWRTQYGWIELVTGGLASYFAVGKFLTSESGKVDDIGLSVFGMVGCVYLVVRGFDNIIQGMEKKSIEEHEQKLNQIKRDHTEKLIDMKIEHALSQIGFQKEPQA